MAPRTKRKLGLSRMDAAIDAMLPYGFVESHVRKVVKLLLKEYGGNEGWPFIEEFSYKELIEAILRDLEACEVTTNHRSSSQDKSCVDEDLLAGTSRRASCVQQDEEPQDNAPPNNVAFSGVVAEPTYPEFIYGTSNVPAEANGEGWKDTLLDQTSSHIKEIVDLVSDSEEDPDLMIEVDSPRISRMPASPIPNNTPSFSSLNLVSDSEEDPEEDPDPMTEVNSPRISGMAISPLSNNTPSPSPPPTNSRRCLPCYGWIESDEENHDDFIYLKRAVTVERKRKSRWDQKPNDL